MPRHAERYFDYEGRERSLVDLATISGLPYHVLYCRLCQHGWSVEQAISTPPRPVDKPSDRRWRYHGRFWTAQELATLAGISRKQIYKRLRRGASVAEAVQRTRPCVPGTWKTSKLWH